jgi:hypothetical protein
MDRRYKAICTGNALAESKEKKTPSVRLSLQTQFDYNDPEVPCVKTFQTDLWLSDSAFERTLDTLTNVFGWDGENVYELNVDTSMFASIECDITTVEEEYNGRVYEKVKFVNKVNAVRPMDEMAAIDLNQKMSAKLALYRQKNQGKPIPTVNKTHVQPVASFAQAAPVAQAQSVVSGDCKHKFHQIGYTGQESTCPVCNLPF